MQAGRHNNIQIDRLVSAFLRIGGTVDVRRQRYLFVVKLGEGESGADELAEDDAVVAAVDQCSSQVKVGCD